jgi:methylthioribose-1-phosphate isomerase
LGVIRAAVDAGKKISVIANETRPFLQGARLTAYELHRDGIPVTVACDNACALLMHTGRVQKVVVGADRIAANGDTANKIGTCGVALPAKHYRIPFYVAAPSSTFDLSIPDGSHIPIEQRPPREVTHVGETRITPEGVPVLNDAFDITGAELITGIITERGVICPDRDHILRAMQDAP